MAKLLLLWVQWTGGTRSIITTRADLPRVGAPIREHSLPDGGLRGLAVLRRPGLEEFGASVESL